MAELERYIDLKPDSVGPRLATILFYRCFYKPDNVAGYSDSILDIIASGAFDHTTLPVLERLEKLVANEKCGNLSDENILKIADSLIANPRFSSVRRISTSIYQIKAKVFQRRGDFTNTLENLDHAYLTAPRYDIALQQAMLAITAGRFDLASSFIEKAENSPVRAYREKLKATEINQARRIFEATQGLN